MAKRTQQIFALAREAAILKIRALRAEEDELVKLFGFSNGDLHLPERPPMVASAQPATTPPKRRMSAAERKAVSKRMKAMWAEVKAGKRAKPSTGPKPKGEKKWRELTQEEKRQRWRDRSQRDRDAKKAAAAKA